MVKNQIVVISGVPEKLAAFQKIKNRYPYDQNE